MTEYHANDPKIRAAMVEYEDGGFLALELSEGGERISGHYSQVDYNEINENASYDYWG